MKKLNRLLIIPALAATLFAHGGDENHMGFKVNDLLPLPMPGKFIMSKNELLEVTPEQFEKLSAEVHPLMHETYAEKSAAIGEKEKAIRKMIIKGADTKSLTPHLEELTRMKTEATLIKIDAFNGFRKILTKEQWAIILELMKNR